MYVRRIQTRYYAYQKIVTANSDRRRLRRMPVFLPVGVQDVVYCRQPGLPEIGYFLNGVNPFTTLLVRGILFLGGFSL